ncbi:MAG: CCA tRNA nucleotidyltransferase [Deltaproteobacteria bacterium]|nr:MAG: CCA tRNA nucleotidyltransferase [Deltaproteobacteria bacterium]
MLTLGVLINKLLRAGGNPVLVGGSIRDRFLGKSSEDFDIEVYALSYETVLSVLRDIGPVCCVGKQFGVFKIYNFDISLPRIEKKDGEGYKGFRVSHRLDMDYFTASLRRDFTINSMGLNLKDGMFLDPHMGKNDIRKKHIRHVSLRFCEDPLRVLRACRFSSVLNFKIHYKTVLECKKLQGELMFLPKERIGTEFCKMLMGMKPSLGFKFLVRTFSICLFPELCVLVFRFKTEAWDVVLNILDLLSRQNASLNLRLAALCEVLSLDFIFRLNLKNISIENLINIRCFFSEQFLHRINKSYEAIGNILSLLYCLGLIKLSNGKHGYYKFIYHLALIVCIEDLCVLKNIFFSLDKAINYYIQELICQTQILLVSKRPLKPLLKGEHFILNGFLPGPEIGKLIKNAYEAQMLGKFWTLSDALRWIKKTLKAIK